MTVDRPSVCYSNGVDRPSVCYSDGVDRLSVCYSNGVDRPSVCYSDGVDRPSVCYSDGVDRQSVCYSDGIDVLVEQFGVQKVSLLRATARAFGLQFLLREYGLDSRTKQPFYEDDIINLVPIVKNIHPKVRPAQITLFTSPTSMMIDESRHPFAVDNIYVWL